MPVTQTISAMLRWRGILLLGIVGMTAGAGLLTAGLALAAVGSGPGQLQLSAAGGALTSTPTWSTTTACPTNFQGSAAITEFQLDGTSVSTISSTASAVTSPFSGLLDGSVGALLNFAGFNASTPGTVEWAVGCYSGAAQSGSVSFVQSVFVSVAAGATTYNSCAAPGPSGCPASSASPSSSMSPSPSASTSDSTSPSPSASPSDSTSPSATPSSSDTSSVSPPPASTVLPSGAPATGAGGAFRPDSPSDLLIAFGIAAMVGSAAVIGLALRRRRWPPAAHHGGAELDGSW